MGMCRRARRGLCAAVVAFLAAGGARPSSAGCPLQLTSAGDTGLGIAASFAGDLNTDGFEDFAIGATTFASAGNLVPGRVLVYFGGPGLDAVADVVLEGEALGDRFGYTLSSAGDFNGDGFGDLIVGAYQNDANGPNAGRAYVYFGGPGFDAMADAVLTGAVAGDQLGIAVAGVGDVNADGWNDVLAGARFASGGSAGRAYVYFGGPGFDTAPDVTVQGAPGEQLGFAVAHAGDVNADGNADFLVGAYLANSGTGRVLVCFGGPGVDGIADLVLAGNQIGEHFGDALGSADLNGDGSSDILVGASQRSGAAGRACAFFGGAALDAVADWNVQPAAAGEWFGRALAGAADLNGDGFADLLVGAPSVTAGGEGHVWVYYGGPALDTIADQSAAGASFGSAFGWSVATTGGDVDTDGADDVLAGAFTDDHAGFGAGRAFLNPPALAAIEPLQAACPADTSVETGVPFTRRFCVTNSNPVAIPVGYSVADDLGWSVPDAGTLMVPAAGSACVVVSGRAPAGTPCASVSTYHFALQSSCPDPETRCASRVYAAPRPSATAILTPVGGVNEIGFGVSTALPGDLNGDGEADFAVGSTTPDGDADGNPGRVFVFFGGAAADAAPDVVLTGEQNGDRFGYVLGAAGDLNGDSYPDLVVGAYRNAARGYEAGRAYVYYGGPAFDAVPDRILDGSQPGEQFGIAVDGAGDVNADGYDDVVVGARFNSAGGFEAGIAYLFFGGTGAGPVPDLVLPSHSAGERMGFSVAKAGDVNGDGFDDVAVGAYHNPVEGFETGRAYVYFGGPALDGDADLVLRGEGYRAHFSDGLAAADVNGDGYADLLVGASQINGAAGRAYVYFGGHSPDEAADLVLDPQVPGDWYGRFVSGGADFNGDGFADFIVGAPGVTNQSAGRVYVYVGGPALDGVCDGVFVGDTLRDRFGWNGAANGTDVTGDGEDDILIGAFRRSVGTAVASPVSVVLDSRGKAFVFSNLQPVATVIESWSASWDGAAVALEWRLATSALPGIGRVRLQRAPAMAGPFDDVATLAPALALAFTDQHVEPGQEYWYRIQFDLASGSVQAAGPYAVTTSAPAWRTRLESATSALGEGAVQVRYTLGAGAATPRLEILDVRGRRVRSLDAANHGPGRYMATWDQRDATGIAVGRGVYLVRFQAGGMNATRKIVVVRR